MHRHLVTDDPGILQDVFGLLVPDLPGQALDGGFSLVGRLLGLIRVGVQRVVGQEVE